MYKIMQRLKYVTLHVKGLANHLFGNTRYRLDQNETKLRLVEDKLLLHPDSPRLNEWIHRLLCQWEKLLLFNRKYWGGLKRKEWRVHGDRNSKYFHHRAMARRKKQMIIKLKDECGVWLDNAQDIAAKFISDYKARFTAIG